MSRVQNKASEADAVSWLEVLDEAISINILFDRVIFISTRMGTRTCSKTKIRNFSVISEGDFLC